MNITPEALDEMKLDKYYGGYVCAGNPPIYIDFWHADSARVHVMAAPGEEVDFPHVNTMERLEMLLKAIGKEGAK